MYQYAEIRLMLSIRGQLVWAGSPIGEAHYTRCHVVVRGELSPERQEARRQLSAQSLRQQDAAIAASVREGGGHIGMDDWGNRSIALGAILIAELQERGRAACAQHGIPLAYDFYSRDELDAFRAGHEPRQVDVFLA